MTCKDSKRVWEGQYRMMMVVQSLYSIPLTRLTLLSKVLIYFARHRRKPQPVLRLARR